MMIFSFLTFCTRFIFFPLVWIWIFKMIREMIIDLKYFLKVIETEEKEQKRKTAYVYSPAKKYSQKQSFKFN